MFRVIGSLRSKDRRLKARALGPFPNHCIRRFPKLHRQLDRVKCAAEAQYQ